LDKCMRIHTFYLGYTYDIDVILTLASITLRRYFDTACGIWPKSLM